MPFSLIRFTLFAHEKLLGENPETIWDNAVAKTPLLRLSDALVNNATTTFHGVPSLATASQHPSAPFIVPGSTFKILFSHLT
jgi:hypothetical protein